MPRVIKEHKFRAWHKTVEKWIDNFMELPLFASLNLMLNNKVADVEVVEYTGLTDKNKKDIYEGDILTLEGEMSPHTHQLIPYKVYWNFDRWGLQDQRGDDYDSGDYYRGDDINNWHEWEIIGNVYENHELING